MVSVSVKIDPKSFEDFQKALSDFANQLGKDFQDEAIHQGHLLCTDAMTFTPPMNRGGGKGLSNPAKKYGELAVKGDVNSMAVSPNNRSAAFMMYRKLGDATFRNDRSYFNNVINNSNKVLRNIRNPIMVKIAQDPDHERAFKKAKNLLAKITPLPSDGLTERFYDNIQPQHERLVKRYDGRKVRKKIGAGMNWLNKYITTDQSVIDKEIQRSKAHVGRLKAGWYTAKLRLPSFRTKNIKAPGGRIPAWVVRHNSPHGACSYSLNDKTVNLSVINTIGNNNNVASEAGTKNIVYGNRVKQLAADLKKKLDVLAQKFNKQ